MKESDPPGSLTWLFLYLIEKMFIVHITWIQLILADYLLSARHYWMLGCNSEKTQTPCLPVLTTILYILITALVWLPPLDHMPKAKKVSRDFWEAVLKARNLKREDPDEHSSVWWKKHAHICDNPKCETFVLKQKTRSSSFPNSPTKRQ